MKPVLMGLDNPYSRDPENALVPYPEGCAGHRLWKMMSDVPADWPSDQVRDAAKHPSYYIEAFDRRNLFVGPAPTERRERFDTAQAAVAKIPQGATAILLGRDVLLNVNPVLSAPLLPVLIHPQVVDGVTWRLLPHPSGRNTLFNDPTLRMLAGMLLADVLLDSTAQEN